MLKIPKTINWWLVYSIYLFVAIMIGLYLRDWLDTVPFWIEISVTLAFVIAFGLPGIILFQKACDSERGNKP